MTLSSSFEKTSKLIEFNISGERINREVLSNMKTTHVIVKIKLVQYRGGNVDQLIKGISVYNSVNNSYYIVYDPILKSALPKSGAFAKYQVDIYIKDKRTPIKYLTTHRQFDFTVYGK